MDQQSQQDSSSGEDESLYEMSFQNYLTALGIFQSGSKLLNHPTHITIHTNILKTCPELLPLLNLKADVYKNENSFQMYEK